MENEGRKVRVERVKKKGEEAGRKGERERRGWGEGREGEEKGEWRGKE